MSLAWQEIARFGKKLVLSGLTSSRFGNISLLEGNKIFITCTGSMLDELEEGLVVEVDLSSPCDLDRIASSETCVHRAIYQSTANIAIIHTHSPYAVALSLLEQKEVVPLDSEGLVFLGTMPIVEGQIGTNELAMAASIALQTHKACIARGHGVFAAGNSLCDAYTAACMAEHSAQVRCLVKTYPGEKFISSPSLQ
ncbi:MAG: aldolase [Methanothrix sp.]|jgi:L-fuculose-phosphate aldolase|nr:aldolase [Methanothrix sp.]